MTEFLPWFVRNFWLPGLVLFVLFDVVAWVLVVLAVKKIFRRRA